MSESENGGGKIGLGLAGLGLLAFAGVCLGKKVMSAKKQDSKPIDISFLGSKTDLERHPEWELLSPEQIAILRKETESTRIQLGTSLLKDSIAKNQNGRLQPLRNI